MVVLLVGAVVTFVTTTDNACAFWIKLNKETEMLPLPLGRLSFIRISGILRSQRFSRP